MSRPYHQVRKAIDQCKKKKYQITCLDLSGIKIGKVTVNIKRILEELEKLEVLYMPDCSLTTLQNLPYYAKLQHIDLTGNSIKDQEIKHLKKYKNIKIINLGSNELKGSKELYKQLGQIKTLQQLELFGNAIADEEQYRETIFNSIQSLRILDGSDRNNQNMDDVEDYEEDEVIEEEGAESSEDQNAQNKNNQGQQQKSKDLLKNIFPAKKRRRK